MCGPENTNRPRGGALAALNRPIGHSQVSRSLIGDLTFHTPGSPSSMEATHVRLTPDSSSSFSELSDLRVVIHTSGDMTKQADECGTFRNFIFSKDPSSAANSFIECSLDEPISLQVGHDGIIGRRVSVCTDHESQPQAVIAEGIVGFNTLISTRPSL